MLLSNIFFRVLFSLVEAPMLANVIIKEVQEARTNRKEKLITQITLESIVQ